MGVYGLGGRVGGYGLGWKGGGLWLRVEGGMGGWVWGGSRGGGEASRGLQSKVGGQGWLEGGGMPLWRTRLLFQGHICTPGCEARLMRCAHPTAALPAYLPPPPTSPTRSRSSLTYLHTCPPPPIPHQVTVIPDLYGKWGTDKWGHTPVKLDALTFWPARLQVHRWGAGA